MRTLIPILAAAAALAAAPKTNKDLLVSTEWLAKNLAKPNVTVLHVGRDKAAYDAAHIPGARFLALGEIMIGADGVPNELAPAEKLVAVFESLGVGAGTRVVLYGEMNGLAASRAFYTLEYIGHRGASVLDGGLEKWRAENRTLEKEPPRQSKGAIRPQLRPAVVVPFERVRDFSWTARQFPDSGTVLVDSRPLPDYEAGHIPGAKQLYWMDTQVSKANPALKPVAEVRKMFEAVGVRPGTPAITYCFSGVQASWNYFLLRYLGHEAGMYDGSMSDWLARKAPVERK